MWGEVKFWAIRYWKWIMVGVGLVGITVIFLLTSRFSASEDSQVKKVLKEEEKIEQTIEKQEVEIKGKSEFHEEVLSIPNEQDIMYLLRETSEELGYEIDEKDEEALNIIEDVYGIGVRELSEEGYIVSKDMTAEQRNIIQMIQSSYLFDKGYLALEITEEGSQFEGLNTYVWFRENILDTPLGIPKPKYHISKHLNSKVRVTDYEYGIGVEGERDGGSSEYTLFNVDKEFTENGYDIESKQEIGNLTLKGGLVAKVNKEDFEGVMVYLIAQPTKTMTGEDFVEEFDALKVEYGGKEVEDKLSTSNFLSQIPNYYNTQIVDVLYVYPKEEGYTGEEPVELTINGEPISLILEGKEFTSKVK